MMNLNTLTNTLGQAVKAIAADAQKAVENMAAVKPAFTPAMGSKFRGMTIVGLNKTEFLPHRNEASLFGDNWQDIMDDSARRNSAMVFFAPRDLSGQPTNPYLFLGGEDLDIDDEDEQALFIQNLGALALFDFCRFPPAVNREVGVLLAADMMFHWDSEDNYISPTTTTGWPQQVQKLAKTYPKNAQITVYTNWQTEILMDKPQNVQFKPLHDLPMLEQAWINQPTFQEKHGTTVLLASIAFAALIGGAIWLQGRAISKLDEQMSIAQQQIPREGKYVRLASPIRAQEAQMRYRHLFPLLVADVARTIQEADMDVDSFEVRNPKPQNAPTQMIATIEAERGAYKGWLQEEPVAKAILLNSATFTALRKPPGNSFKLEGLINLKALSSKLKEAQKRQVAPLVKPKEKEGS